jgi:Domain of Unknown Function (DUF913)/Domain of Unknown Function (DUF908)
MRVKIAPSSVPHEPCWSPQLAALKQRIESLPETAEGDAELLTALSSVTDGLFEEQPHLHEWVAVLDRVDAAIESCLKRDPSLLLIQDSSSSGATAGAAAEIEGPAACKTLLLQCLRFTATLLRNSAVKAVYSSGDRLLALLSARDDEVVSWALRCLACLEMPPTAHRHPRSDFQPPFFSTLDAKTAAKRLMTLSHAWGGRGQGLGLLACVTEENTDALPQHPGTVVYSFTRDEPVARSSSSSSGDGSSDATTATVAAAVAAPPAAAAAAAVVGVVTHVRLEAVHKSPLTIAQLFTQAVAEHSVPPAKQFALLARLRRAKSFATLATRRAAAVRRLLALITLILCHPTPDALVQFLQTLPELAQELVDLVKSRMEGRSGDAPGCVPQLLSVLAVHCLTALVATSNEGGSSQAAAARALNAYTELGIGRGQYTGLLPSLVRHCVTGLNVGASAAAAAAAATSPTAAGRALSSSNEAAAAAAVDSELSVGMAFVQAAAGGTPQLPAATAAAGSVQQSDAALQAERDQLEWVEAVFNLVHVVIGTASGAAALTDCGLVPALLSVVQVCVDEDTGARQGAQQQMRPFQLTYVMTQCVQMLECAIVNHASALNAFRDSSADVVLVKAFRAEMTRVHTAAAAAADTTTASGDAMAVCDEDEGTEESKASEPPAAVAATTTAGTDAAVKAAAAPQPRPTPSQRALLFCILNTLNSFFHCQGVAHTVGSAHLRSGQLTSALFELLASGSAFGGPMLSLACILVADIMNNDPTCVAFVHSCGLARALLDLLSAPLPATTELILTVPTLLGALALTAAGAEAVLARESAILPQLLSLFHSPEYVLPASRCLQGDVPTMFGQGLDEVMRHVPSLKAPCLRAIKQALRIVSSIGVSSDAAADPVQGAAQRILAQQYTTSLAQLVEPIVAKTEHAEPFCADGGVKALLELLPLSLPPRRALLVNASCASAQLTQNLAHYPAAHALNSAVKALGGTAPAKLLTHLTTELQQQLAAISRVQAVLRSLSAEASGSGATAVATTTTAAMDVDKSSSSSSGAAEEDAIPAEVLAALAGMPQLNLDLRGVLQRVPREPLHVSVPLPVPEASAQPLSQQLSSFAQLLGHVIMTEWLTTALAAAVRSAHAHTRSPAAGAAAAAALAPWAAALLQGDTLQQLADLQRSAHMESCAVRAAEDAAATAVATATTAGSDTSAGTAATTAVGEWPQPDVFHLRIVCSDGGVVRGGVEIDSLDQVHMLDMGATVKAFERQLNSGGVMRYRTRHGWVSEHMRGGGAHPIAEVYEMGRDATAAARDPAAAARAAEEAAAYAAAAAAGPAAVHALTQRRRQSAVPGLRAAGANVLARLPAGARAVLGALGKALLAGPRSGAHGRDDLITALAPHSKLAGKYMVSSLCGALQAGAQLQAESSAAACSYYTGVFGLVSAALFDDRRHTVNTFVLHLLVEEGGLQHLAAALRFVLLQAVEASAAVAAAAPGSAPQAAVDAKATAMEAAKAVLSIMKRFSSRQQILSSPFTNSLQLQIQQKLGTEEADSGATATAATASASTAAGTADVSTAAAAEGADAMDESDAGTSSSAGGSSSSSSGDKGKGKAKDTPTAAAGDAADSTKKKKKAPFRADSLARSVHMAVCEALLPAWTHPSLHTLPTSVVQHFLSTVCELALSLHVSGDLKVCN